MGFNLEEMKANLSFGGARANKFNVIANNKVDPSGDVKFNYTCKGASLPAAALGSIDLYYKGRPVKLLGDRPPFDNWIVTVYNDEDFLVRNAFMRWNSAMNAHQGNIMSGIVTVNPYSYKSDQIVTQESMGAPVPISRQKMVGAFPVRVGEIMLDWETTNAVEVFEVEFAYDYWVDAVTTDGF